MTYKEAYLNCKTYAEFKEMFTKDIKIAKLMNPDRIEVILKAIREVIAIHPDWIEK